MKILKLFIIFNFLLVLNLLALCLCKFSGDTQIIGNELEKLDFELEKKKKKKRLILISLLSSLAIGAAISLGIYFYKKEKKRKKAVPKDVPKTVPDSYDYKPEYEMAVVDHLESLEDKEGIYGLDSNILGPDGKGESQKIYDKSLTFIKLRATDEYDRSPKSDQDEYLKEPFFVSGLIQSVVQEKKLDFSLEQKRRLYLRVMEHLTIHRNQLYGKKST